MNTFLITLLVFALALAGMAIGVMVARKPLKGTCGGLGALIDHFGKSPCDICADDPALRDPDCERYSEEDAAAARSESASRPSMPV